MKKLLLVAVLGSTLALSGCETLKENPGLGIGLGVAAGAVAATVASHHNDKDNDHHKDQDRFRYDQSRRHEHHRNLPTCDFSYGNPDYKCVQGDGQIYRP